MSTKTTAHYTPAPLPLWRFTMDPADGTVEDLAIMLRDGYDPEGVGEVVGVGHTYLFADYRMADETAHAWYDRYPRLGMYKLESA